jgi:hypothetical protein
VLLNDVSEFQLMGVERPDFLQFVKKGNSHIAICNEPSKV